MSFRYLLDTNVLSEPTKLIPNENVLHKLDVFQSEVVTASIVIHELVYGWWRSPKSRRRDALWDYINGSVLSLPVFSYDRYAAEWHARERTRLTKVGKTPTFADGQIASIAHSNNLVLVTNNVADFQLFEDLRIENWFLD